MSTEEKINPDLIMLRLLAKGLKQQQVSDEMKRLGVSPNSLSSIEKRLKQIRKEYRADTIIHLFVKLCRRGII